MADDDLLYFNGVNGDSGDYDLPPMTGAELSGFITGEEPPENLIELRRRHDTRPDFGTAEGVDPMRLDSAGWGVIFAHGADPAVKEALTELLNLRASQAGEVFRIYEGPDGHRPDEAKNDFLARHGAGPGPANPKTTNVPYYLLIVGDPERIPYRFQSQLDVQYAVGRIYFETPEEYANYARSVVEAETRPLQLARQLAFFGVANENDRATQLSASELVEPMKTNLENNDKIKQLDWQIQAFLREEATKDQLSQLLGGGDQTPALLFSASHGMSFSNGSARQLKHMGALLCQDWPGPRNHQGEIPQDFYFAGDDLTSDANLLGLIAFFFACYGAGTPKLDEFAKQAFRDRQEIAPQAFLAQLPTRMLSQPKGGALAVIGHVERAWGYSFSWTKAGRQTETFDSMMRELLQGMPVGAAIEYFNQRYAELATVLTDQLEEIEFGRQVDPYDLSGLWTAHNDARGYAILGDPAVRLPVARVGDPTSERQAIVVPPIGSVPLKLETLANAAEKPQAKVLSLKTFLATKDAGAGEGSLIASTDIFSDADVKALLAEHQQKVSQAVEKELSDPD